MKKEQKRKILFYGILAGALLLFAACAAYLAPYDPYEQNLELSLLPPSAAHWMGTEPLWKRSVFKDSLRRAGQHFFSTSCRCGKRSDRNTRRNFQRLAGR